jgi:hypothetical protein
LKGIDSSRKGEKMCKTGPRSGQTKTQRTAANVERVQTLMHPDRRLGVRLISDEGYGNLFGGKNLTNGFLTMAMPLCMMPKELMSSWLKKNPLQKCAICFIHKENISKATAADSTKVSKCCFHRAISGIKLSPHISVLSSL